MAISLCSALLLVTLSQVPPVAPTDSLATLRGRAAQDSSDAQLWLLMGRAYLGLGVEAHGATHRSRDRKSTRLNSSHGYISYAVFCLKKKTEPGGASDDRASRNGRGVAHQRQWASSGVG